MQRINHQQYLELIDESNSNLNAVEVGIDLVAVLCQIEPALASEICRLHGILMAYASVTEAIEA